MEIYATPEDHFRMIGVNISLSGVIPQEQSGKQQNCGFLTAPESWLASGEPCTHFSVYRVALSNSDQFVREITK